MTLGKVLAYADPAIWHRSAINLLAKSCEIHNEFLKRPYNIAVNILLVGTGASNVCKEGVQFVVSIPTTILVTSVALKTIRLFKKDAYQTADKFLPTVGSSASTLARASIYILSMISSVGTIIGEAFFLGAPGEPSLKNHSWQNAVFNHVPRPDDESDDDAVEKFEKEEEGDNGIVEDEELERKIEETKEPEAKEEEAGQEERQKNELPQLDREARERQMNEMMERQREQEKAKPPEISQDRKVDSGTAEKKPLQPEPKEGQTWYSNLAGVTDFVSAAIEGFY